MTLADLIDARRPARVPLAVSTHMAGCKKAVCHGGTAYLSAAMVGTD